MNANWTAAIFPPECVKLLQEAARTPVPEHNPNARIIAIERATAQIRQQHPNFFKE